jgi:hypothetical protein
MINPIHSTNAIYTTHKALREASNRVDNSAKELAQGNAEADKLLALEMAKQNAKVQAVNLRQTMEHSQNIIDILVE